MAPKIRIQRPTPGPFTRDKLKWDESSTVYIPARRFLDFVLGEQLRLWPQTVFLIQKSSASCSSRTEDSIYSERRSYHCAWGPEDDFNNPEVSPMSKTSIRKLGCQCSFEYRKLHSYPNVVCIYFEQKEHIDRDGVPVHGKLDPGFLDLRRFQSTISTPLKLWVYSRLQAKATASQILAEHRENRLSRMQQEGVNYFCDKDDFMKMTDIRSIASAIEKGTWKYPAKNMRPSDPTFAYVSRGFTVLGQDGLIHISPETNDAADPEKTTGHEQGVQLGTMKELTASEVSVHPAGPTDVSRLRVMAMEDASCDGSGDCSCCHMTESKWAEIKAVSKRSRLEELRKKRQHRSLE